MTITPHALANSIRRAVMRRALTDKPGEVKTSGSISSFLVYDNNGGILQVTVSQYKEPIR